MLTSGTSRYHWLKLPELVICVGLPLVLNTGSPPASSVGWMSPGVGTGFPYASKSGLIDDVDGEHTCCVCSKSRIVAVSGSVLATLAVTLTDAAWATETVVPRGTTRAAPKTMKRTTRFVMSPPRAP